MKKISIIVICAFILCCLLGAIIVNVINENKEREEFYAQENVSVETLIKQDKAYFDNMAGKIVFYESRVVLPQAFNESDEFVAQSVTNVFQQTIETKDGGFETTVYMFDHQLNDCSVGVDIHKGAFVLDDKPIDMDSVKITFDKAFTLAHQSNFPPSKSRYITLRHGIGPKDCNAFYTIGNEAYGHLWVDAVTGKVSDTDPAK